MINRKILGVVVVLAVGMSTSAVFANVGATGAVRDPMKEMRIALRNIVPIMRGRRAYDRARVQAAAKVLEHYAGKRLLERYPHSGWKPRNAKPVIWQEWGRFSGLADKLQQEAMDLGHTQDLRASRAEFLRVARTCHACHHRYAR